MGAFVYKLKSMRIYHRQMKIKQYGVRPCIWFQRSFLETDIYRATVELCERVWSTKGDSQTQTLR